MREGPSSTAMMVLTGTALVAIVAVGVSMRSVEPLSSPSLGAEDPFTHVVFTKEALKRGWFGDSFHLGTAMYPPGLHAFAGIVAPLAGVSVYDFARFSPLALGALSILGMFALGSRLGGPAAGLTAALVTAIMPEHIFRTELFFPTALDLAILPAFILSFHHIVVGEGRTRVGAAALFVVLSIPLAFAHPWAVPLFAAPLFGYAMLRALRTQQAKQVPLYLALPGASVVLASAFAVSSRWDTTDTGFAGFLIGIEQLGALTRGGVSLLTLFVAMVLLIGVVVVGGIAVTVALVKARALLPSKLRVALGIVVGLAVVSVVYLIGVLPGLPQNVNYDHMFGVVAITLALAGILVALAAPSAIGDLGVSVGVVLFPLTAFNVLNSPYWPERSVAYLSISVALLAGAAVGFAATRTTNLARSDRAMRFAAPAAVLASIMLVATAVGASPPSTYPWYRLYSDDEFAVFERLAVQLDANPNERAVVYSWQPGLMVKALGEPGQARFSPAFFRDAAERDKILAEDQGAPKYVILDEYLLAAVAKGKADASFLEAGYRVVDKAASGTLVVYMKEG